MASRLLSYLSEVEKSLRAQSVALGVKWEVTRMVNYHLGLARMNLLPAATESESVKAPRGGIFLQEFNLADGSSCVKASLNWEGSASAPLLAVYAKSDTIWQDEAALVAAAWLHGPRQNKNAAAPSMLPDLEMAPPTLEPLVAALG